MIQNFEEITEDLKPFEIDTILPLLIGGFKTHYKANPVKEPDICKGLNTYFANNRIKYKMSGAKVRKYVNYIRKNSILPLIATSKGYYVSDDKQEIVNQIKSMEQRSSGILDAANGLRKFLN